jgi:hypothetical protein
MVSKDKEGLKGSLVRATYGRLSALILSVSPLECKQFACLAIQVYK